MSLNPNQKTMADITICGKCKDFGQVQGTKKIETKGSICYESWVEVCPYCMPTNKYGNLQRILDTEIKLLDDKNQDSEQKDS
jgi:hypothetical protein